MLKIVDRTAKMAGDTLVEVMFSIAIVALAIAISFALSGKNLNVGITARERTQAAGLVQSQIEIMSEIQQTNPLVLAKLKDQTVHFCFDTSNANALTKPNVVDFSNDTLTGGGSNNYMPGCISDNKYYLDINYVPLDNTNPSPTKWRGNSFMFTARWDRVGGGPGQIVTVYYRPY